MDGDPFEPITENRALAEDLRSRIERDGPMTFRAFMEAALYHPQHGYYRTRAGVTGRGGDYVTSPEVHPVFGALVARQLHQFWEIMSRPAPFDVVEQGAGRGLLARDIIAGARSDPAFAEALRYRIVEPAAVLRDEQRRVLEDAGVAERVEWHDALPHGVTGAIVTNELLDAFPVHRVVREGDVLREVFVSVDADGRFVDELRDPSDPAFTAYFESLGLLPGDGCYAEVNLDAPRWARDAAAALRNGYVLTFDYGYEAADLYAPWRRDGTLLCFYRQSASSDPYQRIGKQDITASVNFTTLRRAGEEAGLRTTGYTDQASFLARLGIGEGVGAAAGAGLEEYFARRGVMLSLIDPARLGRIRVLAQSKGVSDAPLRGFVDA